MTFHAYSPMHFAVLAIALVVVVSICTIGRRLRGSPPRASRAEVRFRVSLLSFWIVWQVFKTLWWLKPENFDIATSLPLQLCDLLEFLVPIALVVETRWIRGALWLWGIGLSTQAFVTPILTRGPDNFEFWQFWVAHTGIVTAAVYDMTVRGFFIKLADFVRVLIAGIVVVIALTGVNLAIDGNYLFMGNTKPERPTIIDKLGPWPWRAFALFGLAQLAITLAFIPFPILRKLGVLRDDPAFDADAVQTEQRPNG